MADPDGAPTDLPEPPWRKARHEAGSRTPLSREAIVDAALRVLDRAGADGLSMRAVAEELGTGAASLYWHVGGKNELIDLVVDRVVSEVELPEPDPSRWQEQLKEGMRRARAVLQRHRGVGQLTLGRIPMGPNLIRFTEWSLAVMRGAGVPDRIAGFAGDLAGMYLGAHALEDAMGFQSPGGEDLPPEQALAMIRDYWASMPADRFPNVLAILDELFSGTPDERFDLGLDVIIRGIASYIEDRPTRG